MDKVTVAGVTRQVVNMRLLDADASTVVVHGTTAVIRSYPDPVPLYTATLPPRLRDSVTDCNETNGRGVLSHATDFLKNDMGLTLDEIGRMALSASSDCEAVYVGPDSGFGRIWKELHGNSGFMHLGDRPHRLESLLQRVKGHESCVWLDDFFCRLRKVITVFTASPKMTRQTARAAKDLDLMYVAFQRLIDTRFVAYSVEAIERLLTNRAVATAVLENSIASGSVDRDLAVSALSALQDPRFLLDALAVLDFMRPAVALSKAGQSATYSVFEDKTAVHRFKTEVKKLTEAGFRGRLEEEGPDIVGGMFRDSTIESRRRYPSHRHNPDDSDKTDILQEATDRRAEAGRTLLGLPDLNKYLDQTDAETLITDIFDFARYPKDESDLDMYANEQLTDLVTRLSDGPLSLPRPCGPACEGAKCHCLMWQYKQFKRRVMTERERFRKEWLPERGGVVRWMPEAVLRSFMRPEHDLHADIPDIVELIEICLIMSRSQADTERIGKMSKFVVEGRFEGKHDSTRDNAQDRAMKEVFIRVNGVPLRFFPAKKCAERWLRHHRHSLKKKTVEQSLTVQRLNQEPKQLKFMFC
ncbi:hypothetical protein FJT64_025941 [Amphibalanus amphitrite]|uniref:Uncharacterized protein n=1 Tax=Amphibalanus amphitrite TaxID=1232801 RepID=A0A6A4W3T2_AMPAM|nr:hypothetical protein FJT64_025941 [Amphibalanus amphitrite]